MWLRDSLPDDLPGTRILLYGYETQLHGSQSFQDLEALAAALRMDLEAIRGISRTDHTVSQRDRFCTAC
jgi:hypothetical protein